jgi:hypothetical protein
MRGGIVAAGVVLMIFGAILFFAFPITPNNSGANPFSDLFIGPILGIIGFLVFIVGLAASPEPTPAVVYQTQPAPTQPGSQNPNVWFQQRMAYHMGETNTPPPTDSSSASSTPTPVAVQPSYVASSTSSPNSFCPHCGSPTRPAHKFCRACGKDLDA